MAAVLGTVATAVNSGGLSNAVLGGLIDGRIKCMLDDYTLAGEAAASTITLGGKIPKGANIIAIILYVDTAQTSLTVDVGDAEDADRYGAALTSLQTAGTYVISGQNYVVDETDASNLDNQLILTTAGASTTAGELKSAVIYSTD